jgi:acetyl-CoA synthetase
MPDIESVLRETRVFSPSPEFMAQANVSRADYEELVAKAEKDYAG